MNNKLKIYIILNTLYLNHQIDFSIQLKKKDMIKFPIRLEPHKLYILIFTLQQSFKHIKGNYDWVIKSRFDIGRINRATSGPHNLITLTLYNVLILIHITL
jgi:hypothetical protein